jgi:Flp pilus assembly protein TadG
MKLKSRRGAIVVMLGIMAVTLMSISAISIDFSRLWTLRNELQTSADAAAHAGAVQLTTPVPRTLSSGLMAPPISPCRAR